MKTLSFPVCSGILYRRRDVADEADLKKLGHLPIDCVVVNFYPFEAASEKSGITRRELIEEIDIGGPTLVRAAAKNAPDVLVLTSPLQYPDVIAELEQNGQISSTLADECASQAWDRIHRYDHAIARKLGSRKTISLRYGENPHQKGFLEIDADSPIAWPTSEKEKLTATELSYNNILDLSAAYALASDLVEIGEKDFTGVVIVKHNNPCGVSLVPKTLGQLAALERAWEGDPVSAFGGVLVFTDPLEEKTARWLAERFVELVAAPDLAPGRPALTALLSKRKNLKAVSIRRFGELPKEVVAAVPGGRLFQTPDAGTPDASSEAPLKCVTRADFKPGKTSGKLARFGVAICRALKSNAIAIVREIPGEECLQLVGAGQGQPNRVEALQALAVPRARKVAGDLGECVMVSDAFFPFRDTVDAAHEAGLRFIIQPGGSLKDADSIAACDEHGIAMAFTGIRHFRH